MNLRMIGIALAMLAVSMSACGGETIAWQEEVLLHDGKTIIVTRSAQLGMRRREPGAHMTGDANYTLSFTAPDGKEIRWENPGDLRPLALGFDGGTPYLATMRANLENLTLTGTSAINGTGNAVDNVMTGNSGDNTLDGDAGADTYLGGAGNDILGGAGRSADARGAGNTYQGGAGNDTLRGTQSADTYLFGRGDNQDVIQEKAPNSVQDLLQFGAGISVDQLWFARQGDDLIVSIIGTGDSVDIAGWYLGSNRHVELFQAAGLTLLDSQVQKLVDAMAQFSPPAPGQLTLPPDMAAQLEPVITANWH